MKVKAAEAVEAQAVAVEGAKDVRIRWLIHGPDGAANFHLRQFELAPGGHTPRHQHAWEHEVYVLEGGGAAVSAQGEKALSPGTAVFVEPGEAPPVPRRLRRLEDALHHPLQRQVTHQQGCRGCKG